MVPLAATSFNYMIKRLGPKRWQALHRLAYVAAIAGAVHFFMQVKSDIRMPLAFGSVVGILLGYRAAAFSVRRWKKAALGSEGTVGRHRPTPVAGRGNSASSALYRKRPNVKTFRLISPNAKRLPVRLPARTILDFLASDRRQASLADRIRSPPRLPGRGYCEVTIKREEQGLVSRHMHDTVKEGDLLTIAAPGGKFTFTGAEANRIALLAAGVGITPLMSILRYLTDQNWNGQIDMVYSCKTATDIIFREELEAHRAPISQSASHADPLARRGHRTGPAPPGGLTQNSCHARDSRPDECSGLHVRADGDA